MLFIGDGHAVQGDGELTGDALETSMNVGFRDVADLVGSEVSVVAKLPKTALGRLER